MTTLAPPWVFAADAIDGRVDSSLAKGVHVRALPSPLIGVPATPLVVERALVEPGIIDKGHSQITWIDSRGATLTAPFDVVADNPVLGYLPTPDCVWIQLILANSPTVGPAVAPALTHVAQPVPVASAVAASELPMISEALREASAAAQPSPPVGVVFEALANSADGPAAFARRSSIPFMLSGQRIDLVRVSGHGRVAGVRWLSRDQVVTGAKWTQWQVWSLPVEAPGPRYTPTPNARDQARQRVLRGAATHQPMYAAYTATSPATAPPAAPGDALTRVSAIAPDLDDWLKRLLHDFSAPPAQLVDTRNLAEVHGSARLPIEPHLIASAIDPDAGHWLGFGDVDTEITSTARTIVLYRVRGLWRWAPQATDDPYQRAMLAPLVRGSLEAALQGFPELAQLGIAPTQNGSYLDLAALAITMLGTPPDPPQPPMIDGLDDRGWLADPPPPAVRRMVRVRVSGLGPRALVALAATDENGDRTLNPVVRLGRVTPGKPPSGALLPLTVSRPPDATGPGQGRFEDRDAPKSSVVYRVAQGDWFGRWGRWVAATSPARPRTAPMPPSVELLYAPPASPPATGAASGTLIARIPVPRVADLPAGGYPLARLSVDLSIDGGAAITTHYPLSPPPPPAPPAPPPPPLGVTLVTAAPPAHDVLQIVTVGPAIPAAGSRHVQVVARWADAFGLVSPNSPPVARTLLDPRSPPLPAVPTSLQYSARPDATGHARVELRWPSTPGTRYRVFASTETILLAALANHNLSGVAATITAAAPGAPRAGAFRSAKVHFGWDAFQCLTPEPLVASGTQTAFVHRVSGSLDGLALYRVLSEGASGVLADLTQADLIAVAVPNLGPPAPPLISLDPEPADHEHHGVLLRVKVKASRATPIAWRLRRSSVPVGDPLRMNIVATGVIPPGSAVVDGTAFTIADPTPLARWRVYRWAVEVQAGRPPGAPTTGPVPAGEWSPASAPVSLAVIPAALPAAPASVVAAPAGTGVQLTITHLDADNLIGTAVGSYRFEVVRAAASYRPSKLVLAVVRGAGNAFIATDPAPVPHARWSVRVIDPIGRASPATLSNEV